MTSLGVSPPTGTNDLVLATPQSMVSVSEDILLANGGPEDTGSASLGEIDQTFSQSCVVPTVGCRVTGGSNKQSGASQAVMETFLKR